MNLNSGIRRRALVKSSIFGLLTVYFPSLVESKSGKLLGPIVQNSSKLFHRYPSIDDEIVSEVVGASHFNFDRVKELVTHRPELARATWDWAFGDWETALGAAAHVGRRDIAHLLMDHGARPDIFTFAMLGNYQAVKAMIEAQPGIEAIAGPHGISLLSHAKAGLRDNYGYRVSDKQKKASSQLINYLEKLGTADRQTVDRPMTEEEKQKYLGDYRYGNGEKDGFTVKLNMRKNLSLGKLGKSGGALFQKSPQVFTYNGTSSVEIHFKEINGNIESLTVIEPDLKLKATKV